jgi:tetratricopeptide (TPR) repeat protein
LYNIGFTFQNLGRYQEAIEYYDRALLIKPDYVNALNNKSNSLASLLEPTVPVVLYHDNDAFSTQINYYQLISAATIENTATAANTAIACDEIINIYDRALAIDPNDVIVITNKGKAFYNCGRTTANTAMYNEAIETFDQGLRIDPNDVGCLYNMGVVLEELGRRAEASDYKGRAQAIDPTYTGDLINKGPAVVTELASAI